jgi:uncharacterized protein
VNDANESFFAIFRLQCGRWKKEKGKLNTMSTVNSSLPDTAAELVELLGLIPHPEGGYFLETFRSGSVPMTSRGQTDLAVSNTDCLVTVTGRNEARPDHSPLRNALTSIYWLPTADSPTQPLIANLSDHVHYYQGGQPFQYHLYDPRTAILRTVILGPDICHGHVLQLPVVAGEWKCGRLLLPSTTTSTSSASAIAVPDYCIVSEAVGPGFDFYDFHFVSQNELEASQASAEVMALLQPFLHTVIGDKNVEFDRHYDELK